MQNHPQGRQNSVNLGLGYLGAILDDDKVGGLVDVGKAVGAQSGYRYRPGQPLTVKKTAGLLNSPRVAGQAVDDVAFVAAKSSRETSVNDAQVNDQPAGDTAQSQHVFGFFGGVSPRGTPGHHQQASKDNDELTVPWRRLRNTCCMHGGFS